MTPAPLLVGLCLLGGCASTTASGVPVGAAWVTLAYVGLYYAFQIHGLVTKTRVARAFAARGETFDRYFSQDRELLAADRIQLNTLEHMPVFLILLWLHAVVGDPAEATYAGAAYVALRAAYAMVVGRRMGSRLPKRLYLVTFGAYGVLLFMAVRIGAGLG